MQPDKNPKGKGKEGKNQQDGEKPASNKLKLCRYFQTSTGCKDGDKRMITHGHGESAYDVGQKITFMCQRPKREGGKG
eukprot:2801934-Amphidinium_carterae.1